ncbi:reverse transcriptase domain-containing protein [Tanacetum coccineum]|uniref:Reverse transcriptase domain-containing protein n=1 Tax=Tanacetum coccineum TaxID=301880 RepID=A0ABQ5GHI1_9ASTR
MAILVVQPWERVARKRITQCFSPNSEISFPPLGEDEGTEGPMIVEAEIGGHCVHRIYVDDGSASEILYEHCFIRLRPEIKKQLIPATIPLIGFSVVRSPSPYNRIIGRLGVRKLQAVLLTVHGVLKILVKGGVITLKAAEEGRNKLCSLLQQNLDVFAWKPADMTGVPRHIAEHRLNVRKGCSPVRQKKRGQAADRNQAIQEEVGKLVEAGIMSKVHYYDWLSNPVMVKKHDNSWRMCVDFKDLNKACPKDGYPPSKIDWKMPFGLRNAGATYQRLVDKEFHKQIGKNLKVYIDDLVIKSRTEDEIVRDMEETFRTLREINMKLNPKKCTFGIEEGMFLGYKVSTRGLKVCPEKVDVVLSLPSLKCLKDVQKLNGKLAMEEAFKQMKQLIVELPMLVAPMEKEELIVYLAAAKETVSAVLMTERETKQMPIYFVSRALRGPEVNYTSMEKLVLALVHAKEESPDTLMGEEEELPKPWNLFMDGSSCTDGSGAGLILTNPEGMEFTYALRFRANGCKKPPANVDSRLVANQVNGTYVAKETDMVRYLEKVKTLTNSFKSFSIKQVPKSENKKADALSKIASTSFAHFSKQVLVEELKEKSISAVEVLTVVEEEGDTWMTPIFKYLMDRTLPVEVKKHARWYTIHRGESLADWLLLTNHARGRKKADKGMPRLPSSQAYPKESLAKAKFGLPGEIISDNGKQFQDNPFKDWCEKLCIRQHFASVKHPQTNGLMERANRSLGEGIKARLDERSKNWMEELPHVLWAHRTMIKSSNGDTPFSLTYGTEAVIRAEIGKPTLRTAEVDLV